MKGLAHTGGFDYPYSAELPLNTLVDETAAPATTYVCEAAPGSASSAAVWRVSRITVVGSVTTTQFASTGEFDQIADNRASLTY